MKKISEYTGKIHNVLLDFLRIRQNFASGELQELYRRLGEWHLDKGEFIPAYSYLNRAQDVERILAHLNSPANRQIYIRQGWNLIILTIGSREALVNGQKTTMDSAPQIVSPGRTLVPLRFICEALGGGVNYDSAIQRITICGSSANEQEEPSG